MRRRKQTLAKCLVLLVFSVISFCIAEVFVRVVGSYDADGNFRVLSRALRPLKLPVQSISNTIEAYFRADTSYVLYDPDLGWTIRPNTVSHDQRYASNSQGMRSAPREYELGAAPGRTRIAIFGDSYAHGSDVPFAQSWGHLLERRLDTPGRPVEVLNFGVQGYGIGQAYLRWKKLGAKFEPDIVLFGFCAENVKRVVNVVRPLYAPRAGLPFSKPRFLLVGDDLQLVNVPTVPPEELEQLVKTLASNELGRHEYHFDPENYAPRFWHYSKFVTVLLDMLQVNKLNEEEVRQQKESSFYDVTKEPSRVTLKILEAFKRDVAQRGAAFVIVHLPSRRDLDTLAGGAPLPYAELLGQLDARFDVAHPETAMLGAGEAAVLDTLFYWKKWHYSAEGGQVLVDLLAEVLGPLLPAPAAPAAR